MHQSYSALNEMERPPVWREFGPFLVRLCHYISMDMKTNLVKETIEINV